MRYFTLVAALCIAALVGCNSGAEQNKKAAETTVATKLIPSYSVDSLNTHLEELVDQEVYITGSVKHVCKHSGKRAFFVGQDPKSQIRVEAKGDIKAFGGELIGEELVIKGKVRELRIDEAYLTKWEEQLRAKEEAEKKEKKDHAAEKGVDEASCQTGNNPIDKIREEIAANGKGYKSVFYVDGLSYEKSAN